MSRDRVIYEADWICPASSASIRDGAIAVENGLIAAVGSRETVSGTERVRFSGCALIPGFVNAHTHLELTLFHGLLEGLSFTDWIARLVKIKYGSLDADAIKASARLGAIEMLRSGVTTVGEVMDTGAGWEAMREFGLQGVAYQEVFGPDEAQLPDAMNDLRRKVDTLRQQQAATQRIGISPHAPYTVSKALYSAVREYARSEQLRLTTHIAESQDETLFVRDGSGSFADRHRVRGVGVTARECLPIAYMDSLEMLGPEMLLVHAIEVDDRDLQRIVETGTFVVHCPRSNQKLHHGVAAVAHMRSMGIPVVLGSDSLASNDTIDMFEEMRLTMRQQNLPAAEVFRMATIEGARALGLDAYLGSLDAGKRADFAVVNLHASAEEPLGAMVSSSTRRDVRAVYLAGNSVSIDDSAMAAEVRRIQAALKGK